MGKRGPLMRDLLALTNKIIGDHPEVVGVVTFTLVGGPFEPGHLDPFHMSIAVREGLDREAAVRTLVMYLDDTVDDLVRLVLAGQSIPNAIPKG